MGLKNLGLKNLGLKNLGFKNEGFKDEGRSIMSDEDLKAMQKNVRKLKRIASEKAAELHDLVEDRLPAAYEEIPSIANATYEACKAWSEAEKQLAAQTSENAA